MPRSSFFLVKVSIRQTHAPAAQFSCTLLISDPAALPDVEKKTAGVWQPAQMSLVPIVAYFVGFLVFFRGQIFSGFDLNFGERGDARFVVFIHESV